MTKIEGLMAYQGAWQNPKCFIVEKFDEFKNLIKTLKDMDEALWVLTDTGTSLIMQSITYDFRFIHRKEFKAGE